MTAASASPVEPPQDPGADPEDTLLGVTLAGTYKVERLVAEGGMGRLYAGKHERLGMEVAIKVTLELRGTRPETIERAEREARAMAEIVSPHVARVIDLVRTPDGRPCIVTELLHGHDLSARLERDKTLSVKEAAQIARSVALGLSAAHEKGILHRDIKPSNVFLTEDGDVKLLDFGVAKLEGTHQLTHAGAFIGTPAYMSPEQAASPSDIDERSEVYAIAAVLYHMLAGVPPYGTLDATQTLTRLLSGEPPRLTALASSVPEGLAAIVERAMSREPADRFESTAALAAALEPYASDAPDRAAEQTARWLRPRALASVLGSALLAGVWSAGVAFEIGEIAAAFESWPEWAVIVLRSSPGLIVLVALVFGLRSLIARWRSAPRVQALVVGLRRAVWLSVAALGLIHAGRLTVALYGARSGLTDANEAIAALGLSLVFGALAALALSRISRKTD